MCLKLEKEIGYVDTKQKYSGAAGNVCKTPLAIFVEIRVQHYIHCGHTAPLDRGNDVLRGVIRCWDHKGYSL